VPLKDLKKINELHVCHRFATGYQLPFFDSRVTEIVSHLEPSLAKCLHTYEEENQQNAWKIAHLDRVGDRVAHEQ
jgi:hypothetical protein